MTAIDAFLSIIDCGQAPYQRATLCCGTGSALWRATRFAIHEATPDDCGRFLDGLQRLQTQLVGLGEKKRDRTLDGRLCGLVNTLSAVVGKDEQGLNRAAEAFEDAWLGALPRVEPVKDAPTLPFGFDFKLDRLGAWLVYDVLWHLQHSKPGQTGRSGDGLEIREETAFLVVSAGTGPNYALRLVAELLPGPPGLVTPDWWPMGLIVFSQPVPHASAADKDRFADFVASTQGLLREVADRQKPYRLRWRLEERRAEDTPWVAPITGRSGEAAVVCLGHAVYERLTHRSHPVLNPSVAITATVPNDHPDVRRRRLGTVNEGTIPGKFQAVESAGLREVLVAAGQRPDPLPTHPSFTRVATVADAIMEISATNQYIRAYRGWVRAQFDDEWVEVDTPREEAAK